MSFFRSIRFKLTAWYTSLLVVGLAAFGAGTLLAGHYALIASLDARLDDRIRGVVLPLEAGAAQIEGYAYRLAARRDLVLDVFPELAEIQPGASVADPDAFAHMVAQTWLETDLPSFATGLPTGDFMEIRDDDGNLLTNPSPVGLPVAQLPVAEAQRLTVSAGANEYRVLRQAMDVAGERYTFVTGSSTEPVHQVRRDVLGVLRWLTLVLLALAMGGGYWMSARALRPIDEITEAARLTGIGDLSRRLEIPQTDEELSRLTTTWNGMLGRLENAVRRVKQFTADASHELRTPTAAVRATAELALRQERSPEEYRSAMATVLGEAGRMSAMIDDLLMLARADEGGKAMPFDGLNLDGVVAEVCDNHAILAREKMIGLETRLDAAAVSIEGNRTALRRLCVVLLDNAITHAPSGGTIEVSTARRDSRLVLRVQDDGPGIPPEDLPRLFDRFFRSGNGRARRAGGAGLGLALARSIARDHGATISASNAAHGGAVFSVEFSIPEREPART